MAVFWLIVVIAASLLEMATTQLVSIWFAAGGVCALIACTLGADLPIQIMVFVIAAALLLAFTRPLVKKSLAFRKTNTNADRYIGKIAVVTVEINNTASAGQVNVLGSVWTARSADGTVIPAGSRAVVEAIDGVKLIVRQQKDT